MGRARPVRPRQRVASGGTFGELHIGADDKDRVVRGRRIRLRRTGSDYKSKSEESLPQHKWLRLRRPQSHLGRRLRQADGEGG